MIRCLVFFLMFWAVNLVSGEDNIRIRLLAIKHSQEYMADMDADLAIDAAKTAASQGLSIKTVGNEFVGKNGILKASVYTVNFDYNISAFKEFVSDHMKLDAESGDTLIVFTIGHGFPNGTLQNLGSRSDVLKAVAEAAEENNQKTLWWQLSCHAAAGLPNLKNLPSKQQELLSVLASSTAQAVSAAGVQGKVMEKVFVALAKNSKQINSDGNDIISGNELKAFLNQTGSGRGELLFMSDLDEPVFGEGISLANKIPVVDRNGAQGSYPKNYVPRPQK